MSKPTPSQHRVSVTRRVAQMIPRLDPPDNGHLMGVGLVAVFATEKDDEFGIATDWVWGLAADLPGDLADAVRQQAAETAAQPMTAVE